MKGLKRFFRNIIGYLQNQKGYTLAEMTAVVAVTATLTALAIPVVADKIQQGKLTRAAMDIQGLNQALASFNKSLAFWPGDTKNPNSIPATLTADVAVLTVGAGLNPVITGTAWPDPAGGDDAGDHLITNKAGGTGGALYTACAEAIGTTPAIKSNCWSGPYMGNMREDPWGNNYLLYMKAFYDIADTGYGWLISAGPNATVDTDITDSTLKGDDLGTMAYKARVESQ